MKITEFTGTNDTLLTYALATAPSPLQVSLQSGPPSIGTLTFVISCPVSVGQATVSQISFNLPVGDPKSPESTDLTETAAGLSASVSSSGIDKWLVGPGASAGSFVLKPAPGNPGVIDTQGLTVTITGIQVSPIVGTAIVKLVEVATADTNPPQVRLCSISVPKFPAGFYAGDFDASAPMIQNGGTVNLSWAGSPNAQYTLLWADHSRDVSKVNLWTSPPLTDTTTFILEVSAQEAGQTVTLRFSVTVIVANPDITAKSLTVLTTSILKGTVTADAGLNVTGAISGFGTVPVGSVIPYGGDAAGNSGALQAQGWLFCNGTAVSRSTYATLFSVVGTRHGAGDGSTTFNLPDYRGRFLRGTNNGSGRDPDIALRVPANPGGATGDSTGSVQPWATGRPQNTALTTDLQGNHTHTVDHVPNDNCSYWISGSTLARWPGISATTSVAGAHTHTIVAGGDNETRPINAYVDYLIRFQ